MPVFLAYRLFQTLVAAIFVAVLVFALARLAGDPVPLLMPSSASQEDLEFFRRQLGLDRPFIEQFFVFIGHALTGNFGSSFRYDEPAMSLVLGRVPATALLAVSAITWATLVGVPLGVFAAVNRGGRIDIAVRSFATLGQSIPNFWFGMMLVLVFAVHLRWVPTSGYGSLNHLFLPSITLGWFTMASLARLTRSSMLEVLQSDFVKLQRLNGVPKRLILFKHALKNAAAPILIFTALQLGALLGGAVVTEVVFGWPGLGQLTINAIMFRDFPVIQAAVVVIAGFFLVTNLVVDLLYRWLDPRVRL